MVSLEYLMSRHPDVSLTPDGKLSKYQTGYFIRRAHEPDGGYLGRIFDSLCPYGVLAVFTDYGTYVIGFPDLRSAWEHRNRVLSPEDPNRAAVLTRPEYLYVDDRIGSFVDIVLSPEVRDGTVGDIIEMLSELCPDGTIEMADPCLCGESPGPEAMVLMRLNTNSSALAVFLRDALRSAVGDEDGVLSIEASTVDCAVCGTFAAWNGLDAFTVEVDMS